MKLLSLITINKSQYKVTIKGVTNKSVLNPNYFYLQRSCQVNGSISLSVVRTSSFLHQFFQYIRVIYGILRTLGHLDILTFVSCDFPGNVTSRERWLPGKGDFLGKVTSRERWLPGKGDFPGKRWLPGKGDFPGKVTSRERWLTGKGDFLEKVTSCKRWLPGNLTSR